MWKRTVMALCSLAHTEAHLVLLQLQTFGWSPPTGAAVWASAGGAPPNHSNLQEGPGLPQRHALIHSLCPRAPTSHARGHTPVFQECSSSRWVGSARAHGSLTVSGTGTGSCRSSAAFPFLFLLFVCLQNGILNAAGLRAPSAPPDPKMKRLCRRLAVAVAVLVWLGALVYLLVLSRRKLPELGAGARAGGGGAAGGGETGNNQVKDGHFDADIGGNDRHLWEVSPHVCF